ncbi:Crp/Fnr family transcriptional regulator [Porticoccus sp.]
MLPSTPTPAGKAYRSAQPLYVRGDNHPVVYQVLGGYVLLDCDSLDGRPCIVGLLGPGDYFGPGLSGSLAGHRAVAKAGCRLHRESRQVFQARLRSDPELALTLTTQLAAREARLQQSLFLQQAADLPRRLAWTLAELFTECGGPCRHGHQRDIKLSQQELAAMVGGSRQSVSQILNDWRRAGIIDYTRHYLCLENRHKLQHLLAT